MFCANQAKFPEERRECAIALTGSRHPLGHSAERRQVMGFADLAGLLESWLAMRRRHELTIGPLPQDHPATANFSPGAAAAAWLGKDQLAVLGEVAAERTAGMRLQAPLLMALLDLDLLLARPAPVSRCRQLSPFPAVTRDVAFVADETLSHARVMAVIREARLPHLEHAGLFDLFRDPETFGPERKSMAYTLTFRHPERTLTDDEVNQAHERLRAKLVAELGITLR